ncbi:MAG: UPF0175 family protein [Candidatus Bipolaricaulota bacterium]|nr:UPF0175 family protein [Candidatus Bipolaricaulota bacterium]
MKMLNIPVPEDLPDLLKMSEEEFRREAQLLLAAKLYELGRLTAGMAARLAGVDRITFLTLLARYHVPAVNLTGEEVTREIEAARRLATT